MKIAFDVDDTLIIPSVAGGFGRDTPNYETIAIFNWLQAQGNEMIIWSGSGIDWATTWAEKLGLKAEIWPKQLSGVCSMHKVPEKGCNVCYIVDIAFDDCDVDLAKVNIKVKRLNNSISRKDWNQNKQ